MAPVLQESSIPSCPTLLWECVGRQFRRLVRMLHRQHPRASRQDCEDSLMDGLLRLIAHPRPVAQATVVHIVLKAAEGELQDRARKNAWRRRALFRQRWLVWPPPVGFARVEARVAAREMLRLISIALRPKDWMLLLESVLITRFFSHRKGADRGAYDDAVRRVRKRARRYRRQVEPRG